MHREYRLSVITVNYNGLVDTCSLLDSLTPVDGSTEVIVVDNASTADEAGIIASRYPWVRVIRSRRNLGFAGGNNLGIREAKGDYLFFVNNDTEVDLSRLAPLLRRMDENESIAIVCPKIRFFFGDRKIQYAGYTKLSKVTLRNHAIGFGESDCGQHDTARPTPYVHGAAMLVRREAIKRAGMMPECFFLYYEELDWSMMMRRQGYELWYDPRCTVYHKESQTTGIDSPLRTYYITRNRYLFARRNIALPVRCLTYLYLTAVVLPRDLLSHLFHGRTDLARATIRGLKDFVRL